MEELVKEPKLWGLGSLTNSFGFLRFTVMNENRSFDFLKIAGHGSIIPRPYLPIFPLKKEKIEQMFCFDECILFQNGKNSRF
jgi:hypothetical protein